MSITKDDLVKLGRLALEYGMATRAKGEVVGLGLNSTTHTINLAAAEEAVSDRWDDYMKHHRDLIGRLEDKNSPAPESTADRSKIHTVGELEALPNDTVVLEDRYAHQCYQKLTEGHWSGNARSWATEQIHLPATVIWRPEE